MCVRAFYTGGGYFPMLNFNAKARLLQKSVLMAFIFIKFYLFDSIWQKHHSNF